MNNIFILLSDKSVNSELTRLLHFPDMISQEDLKITYEGLAMIYNPGGGVDVETLKKINHEYVLCI